MSRGAAGAPVDAGQESSPEVEERGLPLALFGLLALTAAIALWFSHAQLIWSDEFGILDTDRLRGVVHLVQMQRAFPICLEPMTYHLIAHASILLLGADALAIRLPSLIGYLTMQVCLFLFVRRCAGGPAGLLAVALSTFSGPMVYASQGRPYGVLLGLTGLMAVGWQSAVRRGPHRAAGLVVLAVSVVLALNAHYYAVLLLVPLYGAEAVRTLRARRLDLPVVLAIVAGTLGLVFVVPFVHGAAAYNQHYHIRTGFNARFVSHAWAWLLMGDPVVSAGLMKAGVGLLGLLLLAALAVDRKRLGSARLPATVPELTLLALLAALPVFGLLLATYVTHTVEIRFIVGAAFGLLALLAMALTELVRGTLPRRAMLVACSLLAIFCGWERVRMAARQSSAEMATMKLPAVTLAALAARPGLPIFIQNYNIFELSRYYGLDPSVRGRIALFYSFDEDMARFHSDTMALTARNLQAMDEFNVQSYEELRTQPGEHLFVLYHSPIDWPEQALAAAHARIEYLGPAYGGDLVSVRFP